MTKPTRVPDDTAIPRGWDPITWHRANAASWRALEADRLARRRCPPAEFGFTEFNRVRGEIMEQLDREADE